MKASELEPENRSLNLLRAIQEHWETIYEVKVGIRENRYSEAREAWEELSWDDQIALWVAPSKGGIFTTEERRIIKSAEFKQ